MSCSLYSIPDRAVATWKIAGTLKEGDFKGTDASAEIRHDAQTQTYWLILRGEGPRGATWRGDSLTCLCTRYSGRRVPALMKWRDEFETEFRKIAEVHS